MIISFYDCYYFEQISNNIIGLEIIGSVPVPPSLECFYLARRCIQDPASDKPKNGACCITLYCQIAGFEAIEVKFIVVALVQIALYPGCRHCM